MIISVRYPIAVALAAGRAEELVMSVKRLPVLRAVRVLSGFMLVGLLALASAGQVTAQLANRQLPNGTVLKNAENGPGRFRVENNHDFDVVVMLATPTEATVLSLYVRAHDSANVTSGIANGDYWLYILGGTDWDDESATFTKILRSERSDEQWTWNSTPGRDDGWRIILNVMDGNTTGVDVPPATLPSTR